jgi:rubrerythrin
MLRPWLHDLESLEAISQNDDTRRLFLRMAAMQHAGTTNTFLHQVAFDDELDEDTKDTLQELASNRSFLLVVEDYLRTTQRIH